MTSSDRFPVPVRSAVKSNLTDWCFQNLSKRALKALTVQASTTELGKLFQIRFFQYRAKRLAGKNVYEMSYFVEWDVKPCFTHRSIQNRTL